MGAGRAPGRPTRLLHYPATQEAERKLGSSEAAHPPPREGAECSWGGVSRRPPWPCTHQDTAHSSGLERVAEEPQLPLPLRAQAILMLSATPGVALEKAAPARPPSTMLSWEIEMGLTLLPAGALG